MKLKTVQTLSNIDTLEELVQFTSIGFDDIAGLLNGKLDFDNLSTTTIEATFSAANAEITFDHKLGRAPLGYIVKGLSAALIVYDGMNSATADKIYLKASATGTARLILF